MNWCWSWVIKNYITTIIMLVVVEDGARHPVGVPRLAAAERQDALAALEPPDLDLHVGRARDHEEVVGRLPRGGGSAVGRGTGGTAGRARGGGARRTKATEWTPSSCLFEMSSFSPKSHSGAQPSRSEERRVGKEGRTRGSPEH